MDSTEQIDLVKRGAKSKGRGAKSNHYHAWLFALYASPLPVYPPLPQVVLTVPLALCFLPDAALLRRKIVDKYSRYLYTLACQYRWAELGIFRCGFSRRSQ